MITEYLRESISGGRSRETLQSFSKLASPQRTVHGYTTYTVTRRRSHIVHGHTTYAVTRRRLLNGRGCKQDVHSVITLSRCPRFQDVHGVTEGLTDVVHGRTRHASHGISSDADSMRLSASRSSVDAMCSSCSEGLLIVATGRQVVGLSSR